MPSDRTLRLNSFITIILAHLGISNDVRQPKGISNNVHQPKKIKDAKIKKKHLEVINYENLKARHLPIYKGLPFTDAKARTRFPICKDVAQEK